VVLNENLFYIYLYFITVSLFILQQYYYS